MDTLIEASDLDSEPALRTVQAVHIRSDGTRRNFLTVVRPTNPAALGRARLNKSTSRKSIQIELEAAFQAGTLQGSRHFASHISSYWYGVAKFCSPASS